MPGSMMLMRWLSLVDKGVPGLSLFRGCLVRSPFFFCFGPADIGGFKGQGVGESLLQGYLPAELMDLRSFRAPIVLGQEMNVLGLEFILII